MTLTTIRDKVRRLLGGISSTEYSDANINISINNCYHSFITKAIINNGQWEVSGDVATANIVADQKEYVLPTDLIALKRIEINFTGGTNTWSVANIIDMRNKPGAISNDTADGASPKIRIFDDSLFLEDNPASNSTNGLKVFYSKEITELSSDSDEPTLPEYLHDGLIYSACLDYAIETEQNKRINNFKALLTEKESELEEYYANRLPAVRPRIKIKDENYA